MLQVRYCFYLLSIICCIPEFLHSFEHSHIAREWREEEMRSSIRFSDCTRMKSPVWVTAYLNSKLAARGSLQNIFFRRRNLVLSTQWNALEIRLIWRDSSNLFSIRVERVRIKRFWTLIHFSSLGIFGGKSVDEKVLLTFASHELSRKVYNEFFFENHEKLFKK